MESSEGIEWLRAKKAVAREEYDRLTVEENAEFERHLAAKEAYLTWDKAVKQAEYEARESGVK